MRSWNHPHQRSMTYMTRKWILEFLTPKKHPMTMKNHRIVFYSSRGTCWMLKFCRSSIRSKVIGDHEFSWIFGTWPDLRGHGLTWNLKFICQSLRLGADHTLVFFSEALTQSGAKRQGGSYHPPPPLWSRRMRNGLCRRVCPLLT